jgi:hypothetical protein
MVLLYACGAAAAARADSTSAICIFSRHDHTIPLEKGPCTFSQRQGNTTVRFGYWEFRFPAAEQGRSYERSASSEGIRFNREGQYTLQVLWPSAAMAMAKPKGWQFDNVFLGRWQGQSTAGQTAALGAPRPLPRSVGTAQCAQRSGVWRGSVDPAAWPLQHGGRGDPAGHAAGWVQRP